VDRFLDALDLPKLKQEEINYIGGAIKSNETEAVIVSQQ
jgi:hypothetical protein